MCYSLTERNILKINNCYVTIGAGSRKRENSWKQSFRQTMKSKALISRVKQTSSYSHHVVINLRKRCDTIFTSIFTKIHFLCKAITLSMSVCLDQNCVSLLSLWNMQEFSIWFCHSALPPFLDWPQRAWSMAGWHRWLNGPESQWSWWWTGRPGVLRFMGSQRVGHEWATHLIWSDLMYIYMYIYVYIHVCVYMYIYVYVCIYMCIYVCI